MKNILNLIFAIVVTLGFSMTSFARQPAGGDDPNAPMSSLPEAGTMVLGADTSAQKGVCKNCQNRNNLKLSDTKDNYQPGMVDSTGTEQPSGTGKGNK